MKRPISFILSALLLFVLTVPAYAEKAASLVPAVELIDVSGKSVSDFKDVDPGAWYYDALDTLVKAGGINGITEGSFEPEREMTLEEYIKTIVAIMFTPEQLEPWSQFDLGDGNIRWSSPYLGVAYDLGLTNGLDLTPAHVSKPATRYEMALLLTAAANYLGEELEQIEGVERAIRDYSSIPEEYRAAVRLSYGSGLLNGRDNNRFAGHTSLKRCEAVQAVVRLFDKTARVSVVIPDEAFGYDYTEPVPESLAVDEAFFADAAFIGNSLSDGFRMYSGITTGTHLCATSLTMFNLESYGYLTKLANAQYGKIYLNLGINEIGYGADKLVVQYKSLISKIQAQQPGADIYVQSLLPVCEPMLSSSQRSYHITNYYVRELNAALREMCGELEIYYLDTHSAYVDSNGGLPASICWDGVHLTAAAYADWLAYLKNHTV